MKDSLSRYLTFEVSGTSVHRVMKDQYKDNSHIDVSNTSKSSGMLRGFMINNLYCVSTVQNQLDFITCVVTRGSDDRRPKKQNKNLGGMHRQLLPTSWIRDFDCGIRVQHKAAFFLDFVEVKRCAPIMKVTGTESGTLQPTFDIRDHLSAASIFSITARI